MAGREMKRDVIEEMRELAKALDDDLSSYDNLLPCENQYHTTIREQGSAHRGGCTADIEPLLADSPRSRFLFTTMPTPNTDVSRETLTMVRARAERLAA